LAQKNLRPDSRGNFSPGDFLARKAINNATGNVSGRESRGNGGHRSGCYCNGSSAGAQTGSDGSISAVNQMGDAIKAKKLFGVLSEE
jgi:hypothetical protein